MKLKHYKSYLSEYQELVVCINIGIISFIADIYSGKNKLYKNCKDHSYTLTILFLHHLISSFMYFGWISNNKKILIFHIFMITIVLLFQLNNKLRCPLTDIVNNNCNITRGNYLRDFLYFSNIKKNNLYPVYIFFSFLISCVKLYNL